MNSLLITIKRVLEGIDGMNCTLTDNHLGVYLVGQDIERYKLLKIDDFAHSNFISVLFKCNNIPAKLSRLLHILEQSLSAP